jgi:hypothetical protein
MATYIERGREAATSLWRPNAADAASSVKLMGDDEVRAGSSECNHLFVLVHGIFGTQTDMSHVEHAIRVRYDHNVEVVCSDCNSTIRESVDGIDAAGSRLAVQVIGILKDKPHISKVSFVAHNIGGLIARYAIGALNRDGHFDLVKPRNLVTFSSPHLGASSASALVHDRIASHVMGETGKQLMMADGEDSDVMGHKMPLLQQIARGDYFKGLEKFDARFLYANVCNDVKVTYGTAALTMRNPYDDVPAAELKQRCDQRFPMIITESAVDEEDDDDDDDGLPEERVPAQKKEDGDGLWSKFRRSVSEFTANKDKQAYAPPPSSTPENGQRKEAFHGAAGAKTEKLAISHSQAVTAKLADLSGEICSELNKLSWDRTDVVGRLLFAHDDMIARSSIFNSGGAPIVQHMVDNLLPENSPAVRTESHVSDHTEHTHAACSEPSLPLI